MEDNFFHLLKEKRQKDEQKKQAYRDSSKERLFKICSTKVRTTMIGALDAIEKKLSDYWTPENGQKPNNEQLILKRLYDEIRQEILDKGNTQIRNLETEFEQYEVDWKRYQLNLPVKQ